MGLWKAVVNRLAALTILFAACLAVLATPAFAYEAGQTWLDWAWEPGNAGIHTRAYDYFEQAASQVNAGVGSCANGWLGLPGKWVFGYDACNSPGYQAATPALADPGEPAYPWAQTQVYAEYLWAWAGYCGSC